MCLGQTSTKKVTANDQLLKFFFGKQAMSPKIKAKFTHVDVTQAPSYLTSIAVPLVSHVHKAIQFEVKHDFIFCERLFIVSFILHRPFNLIDKVASFWKLVHRIEDVVVTSKCSELRACFQQIHLVFTGKHIVVRLRLDPFTTRFLGRVCQQ